MLLSWTICKSESYVVHVWQQQGSSLSVKKKPAVIAGSNISFGVFGWNLGLNKNKDETWSACMMTYGSYVMDKSLLTFVLPIKKSIINF